MNNQAMQQPKTLEGAYPHFTVSVLPYDPVEMTGLVLWRGDKVRSAKNCLSVPSGLLEWGESFHDSIFRELEEELGLSVECHERGGLVFEAIYKNMPGDGFHWVIGLWSIPISNLKNRFVNTEPDKHDFATCLPLKLIAAMTKGDDTVFAPNLAGPLGELSTKLVSSK